MPWDMLHYSIQDSVHPLYGRSSRPCHLPDLLHPFYNRRVRIVECSIQRMGMEIRKVVLREFDQGCGECIRVRRKINSKPVSLALMPAGKGAE